MTARIGLNDEVTWAIIGGTREQPVSYRRASYIGG